MTRNGRTRVAITAAVVAACAVIAAPVIVIADHVITQSVGATTIATAADGSERTIYWRDYPGVAELEVDDILSGPTVDEAYAAGDAMIGEIRAALTAEFGLEWAADPTANDGNGPFFDHVRNGFGGQSLLTTINAPTSQSTSVPTSWSDKERVIEIIGEVTARYGFDAPVLDYERDTLSTDEDWMRDAGGATPETMVLVSGGVMGPTGQWVFFTLQDLTRDTDGRISDRLGVATDSGWEPNTVSLSYGANALLRDENRAEFERRLAPFQGLTPPPPLDS